MRISLRLVLPFLAATLIGAASFAQTKPATKPVGFDRWEKEISAFEKKDQKNPPAKGGVVFTGSSSILKWTSLASDFPGINALNRGFGGSQIADATHFADRIIFPYEPKMIVLRAGGNDIHAGKSAEQVFKDYKDFVSTIRAKMPSVPIVFIGQSPAPVRWSERDEVKKLNNLVEDFSKDLPGLKYIETYDLTVTADGKPRADLFVADRLHFNAEGYKLLAERVRPVVMEK